MTDQAAVPNLHLDDEGTIRDTFIEHLFTDVYHWRVDEITRQNLPVMAAAVLQRPELLEAPEIFDNLGGAIRYILKIAFLTIWELDEKSKSVLPSSVQAMEPTVAGKLGDLKVGQPVVGKTVHQVVLLALIQYIREAAHKQINSDVRH
jgi:hypothetical protein